MFKFFEISILALLFILNILLDDYHLYFLIIYLCLITYTIYKIYLIIRIWNEKLRFSRILIILLSYMISYFVICDPNPLYYMLTFYLPFQNFFRMVFLIIFISYQVEKLSNRDVEKFLFKFISNSEDINEPDNVDNTIDIHEENNKQINENENKEEKKEEDKDKDDKELIKNSEDNTEEKSDKYQTKFFLSDFIFQFKKIKNIFLFILITSIIQFCLFLYRVKFWIYFTPKEKALPIATAQNTTFYIASIICNMEPKLKDYIDEMKKLINYLGPENVMVSIIENGDSKDNTRNYLKEYQKYLNELNVINEINLDREICKEYGPSGAFKRIEFLS